MKKDIQKDNSNKELNTIKPILIFICVYCIFSIGLPLAFKYIIFESTAYSNLTNNEWAGFLGSYVGGILGGLGTLFSVYYTVKTSINMQKAENERRNAEISEEHKRHDLEILDENKRRNAEINVERQRRDSEIQAENKRKEREDRVKFTGEIATLVGEFLTITSNYHYMNVDIARIEKDLKESEDNLDKLKIGESKIYEALNRNSSIQYSNVTELNLIKVRNDIDKEERHYNQLLSEKAYKSNFGNRLKAIECLHILEAKLIDIKEGENLLKAIKCFHNSELKKEEEPTFSWIERSNEEIIKVYKSFQRNFINKE